MIRGAGRYSTLITPTAGSLFHAEFHGMDILPSPSALKLVAAFDPKRSLVPPNDLERSFPHCRHSIFQVRPREAVLKAPPERRNVHKVLGADAGPHRLDALNKVGVAEDILRFEKVQDLEQQFVHGGILGGELKQSLGEFERLVQVLRTFPLGLGVCQVRRCSQGPGRLDQCRRLSKEGRGKPGERVRFSGTPLEKLVQ